jgi:NAD(P)-dependent dehydrogenase (short-subunit alcohol dehydrogenase family)
VGKDIPLELGQIPSGLVENTMTDNLQTVFISGANRGIGYELVRQLSQRPYRVVAGYRDEDRAELLLAAGQKSDNIFPVKVEVTAESDLKDLYQFILQQFGTLDILINNAGVNLKRDLSLNELAWSDLAHHLEVNVGGAFLTAQCLYPLLKVGQGKKIINLSSKLASIALSGGGSIPYSLSKTGLNMLTKQQALTYRADSITVISLSPGWVRTDMGGSAAPLSVAESVTRILGVIDTISLSQNGQFMDLNGELLPY